MHGFRQSGIFHDIHVEYVLPLAEHVESFLAALQGLFAAFVIRPAATFEEQSERDLAGNPLEISGRVSREGRKLGRRVPFTLQQGRVDFARSVIERGSKVQVRRETAGRNGFAIVTHESADGSRVKSLQQVASISVGHNP